MKESTKPQQTSPFWWSVLALLLVLATGSFAYAQAGEGRILYTGEIEGKRFIFLMDADGKNQTRLASGSVAGPVWSTNGCQIGFRQRGDVYVMNADGTNQTLLARMRGVIGDSDQSSQFSPDGSRILFRGIGTDALSPDLFIANLDGSNLANLTNNTAWFPSDWAASWSPDGSKILFVSSREPRGIHVMNTDGADAQRLAAGNQPAWSPDGSKIAFISADGPGDIVVMNADGTNITNLTNGSGRSMRFAWSPDGSRIASETIGENESRFLEVMNADGTERRTLTDQTWFVMREARPVSWSPDGSRIAFTRMEARSLDIYAIDADGANLTRLTTGGMSFEPMWSPTAACGRGQ